MLTINLFLLCWLRFWLPVEYGEKLFEFDTVVTVLIEFFEDVFDLILWEFNVELIKGFFDLLG